MLFCSILNIGGIVADKVVGEQMAPPEWGGAVNKQAYFRLLWERGGDAGQLRLDDHSLFLMAMLSEGNGDNGDSALSPL